MKMYQWLLSRGSINMAIIFFIFFIVSIINKRYYDSLIQLSIIIWFIIQGLYFTKKYVGNKIA